MKLRRKTSNPGDQPRVARRSIDASARAPVRGRGIQSIEVGGHLLQVLAGTAQPMMLRDLAQAARMPAGQAHTYLVSFRKLGLVDQDSIGRCRLGPFALKLGLAYLQGWRPYRIADETIERFAAELDLTTSITIWGTAGPTVMRLQGSSHQLHANVRAGTIFKLTATATGRLFSALLPSAVVEPLLRAELAETVGTGRPLQAMAIAELEADWSAIRVTGFAATEGRPVPGINAVSAPVLDGDGRMPLAITLIGPPDALPCRPDCSQVKALLAHTRALSQRLGWGTDV